MFFDINPEISKSKTLPKEFYLDKHNFSFCKEKIFPDSWQLVADRDNLKDYNIYPINFLTDFVNEPLILISQDNKITCFSNTRFCNVTLNICSAESPASVWINNLFNDPDCNIYS